MTIRVAAIEVSHWHSLFDAAYLRHLVAMPDVALVAVQDGDAGLARKRAVEVGDPAVFTDYHQMLKETKPDFVMALGRHRQMARIAHDLLDQGYPFLMEKPMGVSADEVQSIADKAARLKAYAAVPLSQRYQPFAIRARELLAAGRFGPLSHIYVRINRPGPARYPGVGLRVDARSGRGRRGLPAQPGPARPRHLPAPDRRGRPRDRCSDQPTGA